MDNTELIQHCHTLITELNQSEDWQLSEAEIDSYLLRLIHRIPAEQLALHTKTIIQYFHKDHTLVEALEQADHPAYQHAWIQVAHLIRQTAHARNLHWMVDRAVEEDDLVQIVQIAIAQALPTYHFRSTFATWAQNITIKRLISLIRELRAQKHSGIMEPLDQHLELLLDGKHPESEIHYRMLIDRIGEILNQHPNRRFGELFLHHYIDDWTYEQLGAYFQLSQQHIRALLKLIRDYLKDYPDLWE